MSNKNYLLFAGDDYYPDGGWRDFIGFFDTFADAKNHLKNIKCDWHEIINLESELEADKLRKRINND